MVIAITIIPIPPNHCSKDLQTKIPLDAFSTSGKIVDPVVVIPDTLSKKSQQMLDLMMRNIEEELQKNILITMPNLSLKMPVEHLMICLLFGLLRLVKYPQRQIRIPVTKKCCDLSPIVISTM